MLREVYGEIILKKDSILYHTSDEPFMYKSKKDKPLLFCTFHPSEYGMIGDYVTPIILKKDVSLFFMIESCKKTSYFFSLKFINRSP